MSVVWYVHTSNECGCLLCKIKVELSMSDTSLRVKTWIY